MTTYYEKMLVRWYDGKLSADEIDLLAAWLRESPENRAQAQRIYDLCFAAEMRSAQDRFDTGEALRKVHAGMAVRRNRNVLATVRNIAAAMLLPVVLAASFFFHRMSGPQEAPTHIIEVSTVTGMLSHLSLPDGSEVWLNANTTLRYPAVFNKETRDVELDGEAFFDIAHNADQPFSVHTAGMDIQVTGTRFNVDAYDLPGRNPRAWLEEGGIRLHWTDGTGTGKTVSLVPDQYAELSLDTHTVDITSVRADGALAWKEGGFAFRDTPLEEALRQIGNRFHVDFVLKNKALAVKRYTGDLRDESLPDILKNFKLADGIRFVSREKTDDAGRLIMEVY